MWPFSKKLILKKEQVVYDIGRTKLIIEFIDGSCACFYIYGTFEQCDIRDPEIIDSRAHAKQYLQDFCNWSRDGKYTFLNDVKNPSMLVRGEVKSIEIGNTESYEETFNVIKVVESFSSKHRLKYY